MPAFRLPVRQLVEFLPRTGSIDSRFTGFDRANEGARIHRKLQKAAGEGYAAEVFLSGEREAAGITFTIEGRADGIILNPGGYAHYSVAILDALRLCGVPAVEVLLSEPDEHESFRKTDIVSFGCQGHFIGEGISGYLHAAAYLAQLLRLDGSAHTHLVM